MELMGKEIISVAETETDLLKESIEVKTAQTQMR